jgi:mono/diheme cytochrome c family protein
MSNRTKVAIAVLAVVLAVLLVFSWLIAGRGFSARDEPSALESFLAQRVRSWAVPGTAREEVNPVTMSEQVQSEAMEHYADHCAICHANDGSGDTAIGNGLYPKPPDLRQPETQNLTDGELFYIIHNGIRLTGMPAFGDDTSGEPDLDSWKLVHFIRYLPHITPEELEHMKAMNPKSPHELREEEAIRRFLEGDDSLAPEHEH